MSAGTAAEANIQRQRRGEAELFAGATGACADPVVDQQGGEDANDGELLQRTRRPRISGGATPRRCRQAR